jgi:CRISPR-associated protein Cas1
LVKITTQLIADSYGTRIGKHSERLRLSRGNETLQEVPLIHLEMVLILSFGVSISSDAVKECCERGIPIYFLRGDGDVYGALYAESIVGTVETRREQLLAYHDWRGRAIALAISAAKIRSQANTLRYLGKNYAKDDAQRRAALNDATQAILQSANALSALEQGEGTLDAIRQHILTAEAAAAQTYWEAVRCLVPSEYNWLKREGRGATDPVNSLLNYGYGILYSQIERAVVLAGLDPYAGFIHTDRPGKPTLVFDLIEEFRAIAVDRVVFGLVRRHFAVEQEENGLLSQHTRRAFAEKVLAHLETKARYHDGKRYTLRTLIQMQARHLASFLRRDQERYRSFETDYH